MNVREARSAITLRGVLLCAALAVTAVACDEPRPPATPEPPPLPMAFDRSGRSQDLLCVLRLESAPAADRRTRGCRCDEQPDCRFVDLQGDRRPSRIIHPHTRLEAPVEIGDASSLRFSVAVMGPPAVEFEVRVVFTPQEPGEDLEWERRLHSGAGWIDARIDLAGFSGATGTLAIAAEPVLDGVQLAEAAVVALAAPRLITPRVSSGEGPTNVVIYLIDTLRPDHVSAYGYSRATTPRMDALARNGIAFENAYSTAAWTRPATASLLTSLQPSFHGAHSDRGLSTDVNTLAERFRSAGWSTWAFVTNANVSGKGLNFEQGFDRFFALPLADPDHHTRAEEVNAVVLPHLEDFADEPFLLYVHTVDPHAPYDPPTGYAGRFADPDYDGPITPELTRTKALWDRTFTPQDLQHIEALYDETILYQDAMLGVFLDRLEDLGLAEETLVIITSDHGEELFDHEKWGHGGRLFEEQLRVPLLMTAPEASLAGRRVDARVQSIDVMPTLLEWFKIEGARACQGQDLTQILETRIPPRTLFYEELNDRAIELVSIRDGSWKMIRGEGRGNARDRLYELSSDPGERLDRARSDVEQLEKMRQGMRHHRRRLAASFPKTRGPAVGLDDEARGQLQALGYIEDSKPAK